MSSKNYAQLYQGIQDLIVRGTKVADRRTRTPAAKIHDWLNDEQDCFSLLEEKIPTALADFRRIRPNCEFKVGYDDEAFGDDDERSSSASAYRNVADVLMDFKFEYLEQANGILKLAAKKLVLEGYSFPETGPSPESSCAVGNLLDEKRAECLTPAQLSELTSLSKETLARYRANSTGPTYFRLGPRRIAYTISAVQAWLKPRTEGIPPHAASPRRQLALSVQVQPPGIHRQHRLGGKRTREEKRREAGEGR